MDADKKPAEEKEKTEAPTASPDKPAPDSDSLTKQGNDKANEADGASDKDSGGGATNASEDTPAPKPNSLKQTLKRFRLYLLLVLLIAVVGAIFAIVSSLNSRKTPPPPNAQSQTLSQDQLKQLASSGNSTNGQTITIQGDSVLDGQEVIKNNLNVAGGIQVGGSLGIPALTVSNTGSFGNAQASKLQVAQTATLQGLASMQNGLDLNGNTSISNVSIGTLSLAKIVVANGGQITVPHHMMFTGAFPLRSISFGVLGNGGSASVNGSDTNGTVTINTGNNPKPGCFITVIFLIPFTQTPNIMIGPINIGAGAMQHYVQPTTNATGTTTGFKICTANTPMSNQALAFSYLVTN